MSVGGTRFREMKDHYLIRRFPLKIGNRELVEPESELTASWIPII